MCVGGRGVCVGGAVDKSCCPTFTTHPCPLPHSITPTQQGRVPWLRGEGGSMAHTHILCPMREHGTYTYTICPICPAHGGPTCPTHILCPICPAQGDPTCPRGGCWWCVWAVGELSVCPAPLVCVCVFVAVKPTLGGENPPPPPPPPPPFLPWSRGRGTHLGGENPKP